MDAMSHRGQPGGARRCAPLFVRDDGAGFGHGPRLQAVRGLPAGARSEREFPGNGVGLAAFQRVVHRHGGQVWVEGSPRQRAAFPFTLLQEESP